MENKVRTIKINLDTKKRLEHFRVYRRETYNEILQRIFDILNICRTNPENARFRLVMLEKERKSNFLQKEIQSPQQKQTPQSSIKQISASLPSPLKTSPQNIFLRRKIQRQQEKQRS